MLSPSIGCLTLVLIGISFWVFGFWGGVISIPILFLLSGFLFKFTYPERYRLYRANERLLSNIKKMDDSK